MTGWTGSGQVITDASKARSGSKYVQLSTSGAAVAISNTQVRSVTPGEVIVFGGWALRESGTSGYVRWKLVVYDSGGSPIAYPGGSNCTSATWTYQVHTYVVPTGAATVKLYAEIWNATGSVVARFDDGFLSAGTQYFHHDHLSVRLVTKGAWDAGQPASANILAQQGHFSFGEQWYAKDGSGNNITSGPWQFTSYERDAESLNDYAIFRTHVSRLGRFNRPDPVAGTITDPQSLNRYAYVRNYPVGLVDPLGLHACPAGQTHGTYIDEDGEEQHECIPNVNDVIEVRVQAFAYDASNSLRNDWVLIGMLLGGPWAVPQGAWFPLVEGDDAGRVNEALKKAEEFAARKECDEALKKHGVDSLSALIGNLPGSIYDGRSSQLPLKHQGKTTTVQTVVKENRDKYGALFLGVNHPGGSGAVFLGYYFFSPSDPSWSVQQRAVMLMHEAVHKGGFGDSHFGGSRKLSLAIIEKCTPALKGKLGAID